MNKTFDVTPALITRLKAEHDRTDAEGRDISYLFYGDVNVAAHELQRLRAENAALRASALKQHNEAIEMAAKVLDNRGGNAKTARDQCNPMCGPEWGRWDRLAVAANNWAKDIRALLRPEPATPSSPERRGT